MAAITTEVIIVGAGPTGLALAAQLVRYGVDFVILDKKAGVTNLSKALAVHARTLEIYDQIGLAQPAIAQGEIAQKIAMMENGQVRTKLDFSNVGGALSPFPFVLIFEQSKNEQLLNSFLEQAGHTVRWQSEVQSITEDGAGVSVVVATATGGNQTITGRYLVGCDGAGSVTRHQLGIGFEGSTYPRLFYVADVDMKFAVDEHSLHAAFGTDAFVVMFPMRDAGRWRLVGPLPEYEAAAQASPDTTIDIPFSAIEQKLRQIVQHPLEITNVRWFSNYKVHTRHATSFAQGRCFLAGDAAHVHTPAGGQGMNTGIQDAYNLGWKLALVTKGWAGDALLNSYNEERLANAKRLLNTTDQLFDVAASDRWYFQLFRDHILPNLASFAWRFDAIKEFIFPTLSQIGITYREQSLSWHHGDQKLAVKAGDRLPFFYADGESIYNRVHVPAFHVLLFSDGEHDFSALHDQIKAAYPEWVDVQIVPLYPRVAELFGTKQSFGVLVRPDLHIGFVSSQISLAEIQQYFRTMIGHR